jgi:predicted ATPase/class 3 adenylate cyclase
VDIEAWLRELGLERYEEAFRENEIDGEILPKLTADDLKDIGVTSVGHRRKLLEAIAALAEPALASQAEPGAPAEPVPRTRSAAERRQLTVMFCDLVGSTELSARLDPEDLREIIGAYQTACAAVVARFEGHIAKFLGDGVLAYFGWPRAHEDDAERAVRAGLALVEAVTGVKARADVQLHARIGIATGQVVVGDLTSPGSADRDSVAGETPNLAARLQGLAKPGTVVISQATRRLVGGLFELTDFGPQRLRGFAEPLTAWRVEGEGRAEGRFEARQTAGLTPLVGREEEIALLLRRWRQARDGEGQVVLLSGEPGIGKSRLVRELRSRLEGEPHIRLLRQCSPHHTTSPLHPLIEQLERAADFARDDPPETRLGKLEALLARGTDKLDEAVPLIAAVLGVQVGERYALAEMTPQRQKQRTLEVLVDQLDGLAAAQPVLLTYEDVHWIDPTTQELLGLTIERIQRLPVLLIITFRPEFAPPWPGRPQVSALALSRLCPRDGAAMVERVVGAKALPAEVSAQIVAKTDGVPLFVEELTKTVLESEFLKDAGNRYELSGPLPPLAIPATLHDSLLARLDRLAPVKEVAQIGAAIGREFSHALLAAVADRPEDQLRGALDQLVTSELAFRRGDPPDATYSFKHALVQDAAYETLLKSKRQHLHVRIVQVLEEQFPETVDSQPELLAHHCRQAGFVEQAVDYWYKAGRQAMARSAWVEALAQLTHGLDLLASLPVGPDRDHKELDLQIALGAALIATKGWAAPEVEKTYARARELCTEEAQVPQLLAALAGLLLHHQHCSSSHIVLQIAGELLSLAERRQDITAQVVAHRSLAGALLSHGQLPSAYTHSERGLDLYDSANRSSQVCLVEADPRVGCLLFAALILLLQGHSDAALARSREALTAAYELGRAFTTSQALYMTCWLHQIRGEPRVVHERSTTLIELSGDHHLQGWSANGMIFHGWAAGQRGVTEAGIAELRRGLAAKEAIGILLNTSSQLGLLAGLYVAIRNPGEALKRLDEALALGDRLDERWFEAELHRLKAEALLAGSPERASEAEACYHQALAIARDQGARLWELRAATSLARLWRDQDRRAEAHGLLAPVYDWFTEGFDTADLKDAKALLDDLG